MDFNTSKFPADKGGIHSPVYMFNSGIEYAYYVYKPSDYIHNNFRYPLLLFLHGAGERGNSMKDRSALQIVLRNGPPLIIHNGNWHPKYPFIVVSPQCHEGAWNADKIHRFIVYLTEIYLIDKSRIYLTGLSMGAFGTFSYLQNYSEFGLIAAAVPICGGGNTGFVNKLVNIPIWAFHGDADPIVNVSRSKSIIGAINELKPQIKAKLTIYPGVGHNSWTRTYDNTGMGTESPSYDAFSESIYEWMFRYSKLL